MELQCFEDLVSYHRTLDEMFLRHQEALVLMRPEALLLYRHFEVMLQLHIQHEDNLLLPLFERAGEAQQWPTVLYFKEHRKLEDFLRRIDTALQRLGDPNPKRVRLIIDLLELEGGLKRLLEHHDIREQKDFFPVLDRVTTSAEKAEVLGHIQTQWQHRLAAHRVEA